MKNILVGALIAFLLLAYIEMKGSTCFEDERLVLTLTQWDGNSQDASTWDMYCAPIDNLTQRKERP